MFAEAFLLLYVTKGAQRHNFSLCFLLFIRLFSVLCTHYFIFHLMSSLILYLSRQIIGNGASEHNHFHYYYDYYRIVNSETVPTKRNCIVYTYTWNSNRCILHTNFRQIRVLFRLRQANPTRYKNSTRFFFLVSVLSIFTIFVAM